MIYIFISINAVWCSPYDYTLACIFTPKHHILATQFSIRKDALIAMGHVYYASQYRPAEMTSLDTSWVADKMLHAYYLSIDDQLLQSP